MAITRASSELSGDVAAPLHKLYPMRARPACAQSCILKRQCGVLRNLTRIARALWAAL